MKKYSLRFTLLSTQALGAGNYLLKLQLPEAAGTFPAMAAGQFVQVAVPGGFVLLRRPISICNVYLSAVSFGCLSGVLVKGHQSLQGLQTAQSWICLFRWVIPLA